MRTAFTSLLVLWLALQAAGMCLARDFRLLDNSTINGEVSDGNDYGVVFRLATGGFSERISWSKFTQDALKLIIENERFRPFGEPFIEVPPESKPKPKPIVVQDPTRVDRPQGRTTLFSSATTPLGLAVLGLLYLANLFAAYEIAHFRNRPVALVCGLAALLPLLGPLIFLVSPTLAVEGEEGMAGAEADGAAPGVPAAGSAGRATSGRVAAVPASGLRVAAAGHKEAGGKGEAKLYKRGDYTFNRRFFETQFSGFFRVVPTDAEKDLVLVITTPKSEYVGRRISRISANEFFLQLIQGGGKEVSVTYGEIAQVAVRHKDEIRT